MSSMARCCSAGVRVLLTRTVRSRRAGREALDLVFHQGDQGREHQCRAWQEQ